ncbi:MAG TPA: ABC transporter ATP-binding protein, partial [Candidatus Dormibacteraeota bacterium]
MEPGRCLGIAGPNGAGKSSLLGALAGWLHPTSGEVLLHGHPVHGRVPAEVGFAAQEVSFYPHLSGRHNLELFGRLYDLAGDQLRNRVDALVERFELEDWIEREARTYSGGLARRLHLAIALINEPDLVLLDEPTTGLDPGSRSTLVRVITELLDAGNAVVMVSQVLADLEIVAHRLMVVVEGRAVLEDEMESVMARAGA